MKTTGYMQNAVLPGRPEVRSEWIEITRKQPDQTEVQADGRIRYWRRIPEFGNRALRVVTLEDGETVHNAFFDRSYARRRR